MDKENEMVYVKLNEIEEKIDTLIRMTKAPTQQPLTQPLPPKQTWPAICSMCGVQCQVPFKPSPGSQIKCRQCYAQSQQAGY